MEPIRLQVLKAMVSALEGTVYKREPIGGVVFRGRTHYGESDPVPMLSILEPPIPLEMVRKQAQDNTAQTGDWELLVQGWAEEDPINPTDPAYYLLHSVKKVLMAEKRRNRGRDIFGMGDVVIGLDVGHGAVRPPDEISTRAYFWLLVTLRVVEQDHA